MDIKLYNAAYTVLKKFWPIINPKSAAHNIVSQYEMDTKGPENINEFYLNTAVDIVSKYYITAHKCIKTKSRIPEFVEPRHMIRWLLCQNTRMQLKVIANMTGATDHSSVVNSKQKINDWRETDKLWRTMTDEADRSFKERF